MTRMDRALGILLRLASRRNVSAAELAREMAVSRRTIYREIDSLSGLGVPVYAERGHGGGLRLLDSYFLPPVRLSSGEAISLLLGMALLESLPARPFAADGELASAKLLAALAPDLSAALTDAPSLIGFEQPPIDTFHYEVDDPIGSAREPTPTGTTTGTFLLAALHGRPLVLRYRSPYSARAHDIDVVPLGILWDRRRWYLAGWRGADRTQPQLFRADRVHDITVGEHPAERSDRRRFDVRSSLGRKWLASAMQDWAGESPVVLHLTRSQANGLQEDWYYCHAQFAPLADGRVQMTYGGDDCDATLELLRWLGPGATLVEPAAWPARHVDLLRAMLAQAGSNMTRS